MQTNENSPLQDAALDFYTEVEQIVTLLEGILFDPALEGLRAAVAMVEGR